MWSPIFVLFFVAITSADYGWKAGTQYSYEIRGRTLTGHHQKRDQYSGLNFRAKLSVQAKTDSQLSLQVHGPEYAEIHGDLSDGWTTEIPDEKLNYMHFPISSDPFEVRLNKSGVVDRIVVDKNIPTWELNVLRSIVSLLQVDTSAENLKKSNLQLIPSNDDVSGTYKTKESSVYGTYDTIYDISELPNYIVESRPEIAPLPYLRGEGKFINVVKTRNFSQSEQHMVYHHGMSGAGNWEPGSNHMGNFISRSSVSRLVLSGSLKRYTIQSSVTDEKIIVAPHLYDQQKSIVASRMNLTLQGVSQAQGPPPAVRNAIHINDLVYKHEKVGDDGQEESLISSSENSSNHRGHIKNASLKNQSSFEKNKLGFDESSMKKSSESSESSESSSSSSSSSSSEDSESLDSREWYHNELSPLDQTPQASLLPFYVGKFKEWKEVNVIERAVILARDIARDIKNPDSITGEGTLTKFTILTKVVMAMSAQQLNEATQKLYTSLSNAKTSSEDSHNYQAWISYRDAVAQAGTGSALLTIRDWITSKKVAGQEAAHLLSTVSQTARFPGIQYMRAFFEIVKDDEVVRQNWLNTSAILSFTDLVRKSMVDRRSMHNRYPVHIFGPTFGKKHESYLDEYLNYFDQKLDKAVKAGDSNEIQAYTRAIGNIADRKILASYEPYLEGKKPVSDFQRLVMIASMDKLTKTYPNQARAVLYRIYRNMGDTPEVRTAAVMQIMKTNPPPQVLQSMAQQTNFDHCRQVNAAVKSAIESAAFQPVNKYNRRLVESAKSAVDMLTTETFSEHNSRNFIRTYIVKEGHLAYTQHLSYIQSPDSILPRSVFFNLKRNIGGFKRDEHEMQWMSSSVDEIIAQLVDEFFYGAKPSGLKNKRNWNSSQSKWSFENINRALNFQNERQKQLEGNLLFTGLGGKMFYTFDNYTLGQIPKVIQEMRGSYVNGKNFNFTKYYNQYSMELAFSTAMGLPFVYALDVPTVVSFGGHLSAGERRQEQNFEKSSKNQIPATLSFGATGDFVYSAKRQGKMGFVAPFISKMYLSGVEKNLQIRIPLRTLVGVDSENKLMELSMEPIKMDQKSRLFECSSNTYTTVHNALDFSPHMMQENTKLVHTQKSHSYGKTYGDKATGFAFDVNMTGEGTASDLKNMMTYFEKYDPLSFWLYYDMDATKNNHNATIVYNPFKSTASKMKITVQYLNATAEESENVKSGFNKHKRSNTKRDEVNLSIASSFDKKQRRDELLRNAMAGIRDAEGRLMDMDIDFSGKQNKKYVVAMAYGHCPTSENSRFLAYFWNSSQSSQNRHGFQAGIQVDMKYPKVPLLNFNDAMTSDPTSQMSGKLDFGEDMPLKSRIYFEGVMKASENRRNYLRRHPLGLQCEKEMEMGRFMQTACQNMTNRANYLDSYQFTVSYENLPASFKNFSYKAYSTARYFGYPYHQENSYRGSEGHLGINVNYTNGLGKANVSLTTPDFLSNFVEVPIHRYIRPLLVVHPAYGAASRLGNRMFYGQHYPTCILDGESIKTFDNKSFTVNMGRRSHVMAQSAYNKLKSRQNAIDETSNYFSVIARYRAENQLEINVLAGENALEVQPQGEKTASFVFNGENFDVSESSSKKLEDEQGKEVFHISYMPRNTYRIASKDYGFEILWNSRGLRLRVDNGHRGKVRGLCGDLDGESYNDFVTPQGLMVNNSQAFAYSYAFDEEADGSRHMPRMDAEGVKEEVILGNVISAKDYGKSKSYRDVETFSSKILDAKTKNEKYENLETTYRVKIVREPGKTCFSLKPQLSCGTNFEPKLIEKTIEFHCVPNSSASKHWEEMVKMGANPDFTQKGPNHRATLKLTQQCVSK